MAGSSFSLRYQLVRRYHVPKKSVSFRYKLWHFCYVLSWSVSLRYQLVHHYDVSNWSVFSTNQWDVAKMSQIGPFHSRTCCDFMIASATSRLMWDLAETSLRRRMPDDWTIYIIFDSWYILFSLFVSMWYYLINFVSNCRIALTRKWMGITFINNVFNYVSTFFLLYS